MQTRLCHAASWVMLGVCWVACSNKNTATPPTGSVAGTFGVTAAGAPSSAAVAGSVATPVAGATSVLPSAGTSSPPAAGNMSVATAGAMATAMAGATATTAGTTAAATAGTTPPPAAGMVAMSSAGSVSMATAGTMATSMAGTQAMPTGGMVAMPNIASNRLPPKGLVVGACDIFRLALDQEMCKGIDELVTCATAECGLDDCAAKCKASIDCALAGADHCKAMATCDRSSECSECMTDVQLCALVQKSCKDKLQCASAAQGGSCKKLEACCEIQNYNPAGCLSWTRNTALIMGDPGCDMLIKDENFVKIYVSDPVCRL